MAFFPRTFADPSFTPLFRLLDDFDTYSREASGQTNGNGARAQSMRTFSPKFDVRETEHAYELHGELPGIERENISIEFTEPQTVVIRGRIERSYTSGTPPAGLVEGGGSSSGKAIEGQQQQQQHPSHKATVEDEAAEKAKEEGKVSNDNNQVAVKKGNVVQQHQQQQPAEKYWVSERSIGEFSRTFSFPTRVDQEAVTANLNNGVLSVVVPKAKKRESKRITIS